MWAVHALVFGKKPKAIFWCLLLPLCVVQIHFSGVALYINAFVDDDARITAFENEVALRVHKMVIQARILQQIGQSTLFR